MKIGVIGVGHVGLVTAAAFADLGHEVVAMDLDPAKIELLDDGKPPFEEPDLQELLQRQPRERLSFVTDPATAVRGAHVVFICVGRPAASLRDTSLTAVEAVGREIARHATPGVVIAEKSTVPPGTADRLRLTIARERADLSFSVVANPEFLREGRAVHDTLEPDRVVVGSDDEAGFAAMRELYAPLTERGIPLLETDVRTAELAKLASNAFLATKISFANALARIAEANGADVTGLTEVMGADARIGPAFLAAGLGYGGYCLPKDTHTLLALAERSGYDFSILREVMRENERAVDVVAALVEEAVWNLEGKRLAFLGLAFKAGTDDVRSSPGLALARRFIESGATVIGYDELAGAQAKAAVPELVTADDPYEAATGAHCIVVCTEDPAHADLDLDRLREVAAYPIIVDGRNVLDPDRAEAAGFTYLPVGKPPRMPETGPRAGGSAGMLRFR